MQAKLRPMSVAVIAEVVELTGSSRQGVIDCLLRALSASEIAALVRERMASDAAAEAAWKRGRS